jgi:hypothetical protein
MDVGVISALYKARPFHKLIAVQKFTCLQANIVDCSREDIKGGVDSCSRRMSNWSSCT